MGRTGFTGSGCGSIQDSKTGADSGFTLASGQRRWKTTHTPPQNHWQKSPPCGCCGRGNCNSFPPEGLPIKLTGREAKLLGHMVRAYPNAVARQALVNSSDAVLTPLDFRHLEVALSRLRKKIQDATGQGLILASRSEGYLFGAPIRLDADHV